MSITYWPICLSTKFYWKICISIRPRKKLSVQQNDFLYWLQRNIGLTINVKRRCSISKEIRQFANINSILTFALNVATDSTTQSPRASTLTLSMATEGVLARLRRSSLTLLLGIENELKRKTRRLKFREDVDVVQLEVDDVASEPSNVGAPKAQQQKQKLKEDNTSSSYTSSEDDLAASVMTSGAAARYRRHRHRHIFALEHCSIYKDVQNRDRVRLLFHLGVDYVNEKISVQAARNGRVVMINAQRYAPLGDGTQFLRVCADKHTLPCAIDANRLHVSMDDEGCLLVEAPVLPDSDLWPARPWPDVFQTEVRYCNLFVAIL